MGEAEVDGYEFEAGKYWDNVFVSIGVWNADNTFNEEALTDADLGLGTSIGRTWTARFQYTIDSLDLNLGAFQRFVEEEPNTISETAPPKESYAVTDLYASWRPLGDDTLVLSASIRNLFDKFYYDHGTYGYNAGADSYIGFPAAGIEPSLSVAVKF